MSLITIDRSVISPTEFIVDELDEHIECSSKSSQSEDFFMCRATIVGLNVHSRRRCSVIQPNDDMQNHLKEILNLLRFEDYLQLVVRLQSDFPRPHHHRYCCVISTSGKQGTEESAILGLDITNRRVTIGLLLPIWQDMSVKLYGDGGFELITKDTEKQCKPVSVQALWAAFQTVNRACQVARANAYYSRGLSHDWVSYYYNQPASDAYQMQEWSRTDDIDSFNQYASMLQQPLSSSATDEERERLRMENVLREKLQHLMYIVDLEEVTVRHLREQLEAELCISLHDYRHFIESEVLSIYGRMDEASVILDHLLLGNTFNASNRAELERRSVSHIVNVTREVDNFFPGDKYEYKNIRQFDDENATLLPYFEETHRFINEARSQGTACLVHCKMGMSRSATMVISYVMKEKNWDLDTALAFVKHRRPCIQPNPTFLRELQTYQGILEASSNRHKPIFRKGESPHNADQKNTRDGLKDVVLIVSPHETDTFPIGECEDADCTFSSPSTPTNLSTTYAQTDNAGALDLEAELFAFKREKISPSLLILPPDPLDPSNNIADESCTATTFKEGTHEADQRAPVVVAHTSQCLRHWHPSLVEYIPPTMRTLCPSKSNTKSPTDTVHQTEVVQNINKCQEEIDAELEPLKPVTPIDFEDGVDKTESEPVNRDTDSCYSYVLPQSEYAVIERIVSIHESYIIHLATSATSPPNIGMEHVEHVSNTNHGTEQPSIDIVAPVRQLSSNLIADSVNQPISTMATPDARLPTVHTTISKCNSPKRTSPNRISLPACFIQPFTPDDNQTKPESASPAFPSRLHSLNAAPKTFSHKPCSPERLNAKSFHRDDIFRPLRDRSPDGMNNSLNRTQSARFASAKQPCSARLRPDTSWIVTTAPSSADTSGTSELVVTHPMRPVSALLMDRTTDENDPVQSLVEPTMEPVPTLPPSKGLNTKSQFSKPIGRHLDNCSTSFLLPSDSCPVVDGNAQ